ncbi:DUF4382 domain-containing protein [Leptobacterium flavescens]|uniref:DUF4382 domain-containing protein n=1 Tax=Leptobacterium flavescens TaxID=472055 RepID=A0A6P0UVC2_9FLAO|nr:DUF4382 domain-containing protein [Leptobacterium flavescens]NER14346.1 DUF4382 domain-containing protein [Leptobacterium flavescens]
MKYLKTIFSTLLIISFTFLFFSCNNDDSDGLARVSIRLVDGPGDFEAVNIDVQDVLIKRSNDEDDENGWESIGAINSGVYNLLELTGGVNVLLIDTEIPAGRVNQIRLLLGDNNTVVSNGEESALSTPSAQQSGLKLQINEELISGVTYNFTIDFDVDKSVVTAGNSGRFNLKPVLRVSTEATSGVIRGMVDPSDFQVMVEVMVGEEIVSTFTNEEGAFSLNGIPSGIYTVTLTPDPESGLSVKTVENVEVINGQITDIGTITLE